MNHTGGALPSCTQRAYLYLERNVDVSEPPYDVHDLELMAFRPR
jgi:hypothetical protein